MTQPAAKQSGSQLRPPRPLRVVLYAHVNGRDTERLRSLAVQMEILGRHSRGEGWTTVGEFADAAAGGSADRPGLRALCDAQYGQYDILLVHAFDRLARSVCDAALMFDELDRAGVLVLSVTDVLDIASMDQRAGSLVRSALAASQDSSPRTSAGRALVTCPGEEL